MLFELKRVDELDEEIRWEIWIDGTYHKGYKQSSMKDPEKAARDELKLMAERARNGFPKTIVVEEINIPENTKKVIPKIKK